MRLILKLLLILSFGLSVQANEKLSSFMSNLIPGEGLTEASIEINEDDNPDLEILAFRDINYTENSYFYLK